jgi:hypothetical protein
MPMDFPDMKSLVSAAKVWKFREPLENEKEDEYRFALADFVKPKDIIESQEIRHKVGWDQWNNDQSKDLLRRSGFSI